MSSPREFNPPAQMLARLAFAAHLGLALWGVALGVGAWIEGRADLGAQALIAIGAAAALGWILRQRHAFESCRNSLDNLFCEEPADETEEQANGDPELAALLARRAMLECQRGEPGFDPWALLALQHDIEARLRDRHPPRGRDRA